jgi:hypothetical protein
MASVTTTISGNVSVVLGLMGGDIIIEISAIFQVTTVLMTGFTGADTGSRMDRQGITIGAIH